MKTLSKRLVVSCSLFLQSFSWSLRGPASLAIFRFLFTSAIIISCSFFIAACSQPAPYSGPILHRLMLFKYKAEVSQPEIDEVKQTFFGLKEKVPGMIKVVWARDLKFNREKQYTYALILSFTSKKAMKAYKEHPDHKALAKKGDAMIETFYSMDYWTGVDSNKEEALE